MNKEQLAKLNKWMFRLIFVLPIISGLLVVIFGRWAILWACIPMVILETEAIFLYVISLKGKTKFIEDKLTSFGIGFSVTYALTALYAAIIFCLKLFMEDIIENWDRITRLVTKFFRDYGIYILMVVGAIAFFILWFYLNKKLAIKVLGEDKVK